MWKAKRCLLVLDATVHVTLINLQFPLAKKGKKKWCIINTCTLINLFSIQKQTHKRKSHTHFFCIQSPMANKYFPSFPETPFLCILTFLTLMFIRVSARPATFAEDFKAAYSESHIRQVDGGKAIQLVLDQSTGIHTKTT